MTKAEQFRKWRGDYDALVDRARDTITVEWLRAMPEQRRVRPPAFDHWDVASHLLADAGLFWWCRGGERRYERRYEVARQWLRELAQRGDLIVVDDGRCVDDPLYLLPEDAGHAARLGRRIHYRQKNREAA